MVEREQTSKIWIVLITTKNFVVLSNKRVFQFYFLSISSAKVGLNQKARFNVKN